MIIDEQAAFRSLLMHHVTAHWPDAVITAYDPTIAGHLPDEFSGAGNDLVLLGDRHGDDREGADTLRRFRRRPGFPPVVYFGAAGDEAGGPEADAFIRRDAIEHDALVGALEKLLASRRSRAAAASIMVDDPRTGRRPRIPGYRFVRTLAVSRCSAVYLAEDEASAAAVAIKVLRGLPDRGDCTGAIDRFLQEYETIAEIRHPHVVGIRDLGISDEHAHIVMEYLDAGDLRARIDSGLEEHEAVGLLRQMAGGLAAIHEHGVLHRDIKPSNVMLRGDGTLAYIDFGLAQRARLQAEATDVGDIFGTPYYMSPEQGHGDAVDARSDIYSLGVVFYEMLTGERPYTADTAMGIIYRHAHAPIPRMPASRAACQPLVDRMLAKKPADRLQHAEEIERWL